MMVTMRQQYRLGGFVRVEMMFLTQMNTDNKG
jgi:hypothetical protein